VIASFYKNLKTMAKVEALRQAQLNLIRGNVNSDLLAREASAEWASREKFQLQNLRLKNLSRSQRLILISGRRLFWWARESSC